MLGSIGVRAGDEHAPLGFVPIRCPHLLAVHHPLVPVELGSGSQPGQIRTGARFTEQLAPRLLAGDDVADVVVDLLLGAREDEDGVVGELGVGGGRKENRRLGAGRQNQTNRHDADGQDVAAHPLVGPARDGEARQQVEDREGEAAQEINLLVADSVETELDISF